jgi:surface protein
MGGDALRAVARGSLSMPRQDDSTWREWAGGLSTARIAGGTLILSAAAIALAAAVHATRQKAHTQSTKELIDMYIKASEDDSHTIARCLVSRVHELRDALGWSGWWNAERKIAAKHILEDICRIKLAQNRISPSRALEAQIKFLEDAVLSPLAQKFLRNSQPYPNAGQFQLAPKEFPDQLLAVPSQRMHETIEIESYAQPYAQSYPRMHETNSAASIREKMATPKASTFAQSPLDHNFSRLIDGGESGIMDSVQHQSAASENKGEALPTRLADVTANMTSLNVGKHSQYGHVATWDVRYVSDMSAAFISTEIEATDLADLSFWDTRNVTTMASMFRGASKFNGEIGDWNTHKVTDMSQMFCGADSFNSDITRWDVQSVIRMHCMFGSAIAFNQDISGWDVRAESAGRLELIRSMFAGARAFSHQEAVEHQWLSAEQRNAASPRGHATIHTKYGRVRQGRVYV